MNPTLSQAVLQLEEALRQEHGVDFSFRILGGGQVLAEHSVEQVKRPEIVQVLVGTCSVCRKKIRKGSQAPNIPGLGVVHPACAPTAPPASPPPSTKRPDGNTEMTLPFMGCCAACAKDIPAGSRAVHVPHVGMHHQACVPAKKEG